MSKKLSEQLKEFNRIHKIPRVLEFITSAEVLEAESDTLLTDNETQQAWREKEHDAKIKAQTENTQFLMEKNTVESRLAEAEKFEQKVFWILNAIDGLEYGEFPSYVREGFLAKDLDFWRRRLRFYIDNIKPELEEYNKKMLDALGASVSASKMEKG